MILVNYVRSDIMKKVIIGILIVIGFIDYWNDYGYETRLDARNSLLEICKILRLVRHYAGC